MSANRLPTRRPNRSPPAASEPIVTFDFPIRVPPSPPARNSRIPDTLMVLMRAVGAYTRALIVAPLPTKAITAAVVAATGDAFAQRADPAAAQYDVGRAATFASFGALYTGAFQHSLFSWLDAHCHGAALASLLERYVLLDVRDPRSNPQSLAIRSAKESDKDWRSVLPCSFTGCVRSR